MQTTDIGGVPAVVTGGGGYGWGDGCGGILGVILIIALLGGGLGFGGYGRGRDGGAPGYDFGLQKDILENRYVNEKNAGIIVHNNDVNTGKILDKMTSIEMQNLRDENAGLKTALSEQRITATILQNLQPPRAVPSYPAPNPYTPFMPNYGYGYPCGAAC